MRLSELKPKQNAQVIAVIANNEHDFIAARLQDLGFVQGESVKIITYGPFSADPLLVQIGFTRFALRKNEAERIEIELI